MYTYFEVSNNIDNSKQNTPTPNLPKGPKKNWSYVLVVHSVKAEQVAGTEECVSGVS